MNPDPALVSDPIVVLLAWAGGAALAGAIVTALGLVGAGFTWLAAGTTVLVGIWPALAGDMWAAGGVAAAAVGGALTTIDRRLAGALLATGGALLLGATAVMAGWPLAATATLALGGITGEMLLGHWYLVDPTLSRKVLRGLAIAGLVGMASDVAIVGLVLGFPDDGFLAIVLAALAVTTMGLMAAVIGALRYPAYSGVMAATGLSYLAVLTGLAAVFFGRVFPTGGVTAF
ncbi:MAG: hypothetical protein ACRDVD_09175 [Acidimicrobiia bacterium]